MLVLCFVKKSIISIRDEHASQFVAFVLLLDHSYRTLKIYGIPLTEVIPIKFERCWFTDFISVVSENIFSEIMQHFAKNSPGDFQSSPHKNFFFKYLRIHIKLALYSEIITDSFYSLYISDICMLIFCKTFTWFIGSSFSRDTLCMRHLYSDRRLSS